MPENVLSLRVFLSSPGDVNDERKAVLEALDRLPNRPSFREKITFRVIAWDKPGADTPMLATMSPQEAIDAGLPKPSECDIVITIFYSRMGTSFTMHGTPYLSGTQYELLDALNCDNPPHTLIYHRTEKPDIDPDDDDAHLQYRTLKKFLKGDVFFDSHSDAIRRGVNAYTSPAHFRESIENHLEAIVLKLLQRHEKSPIPEKPPVPKVADGTSIEFKTELWQGSPFPGLRSFTPDDEDIFFGRERETDSLVKRVSEAHHFVGVIGASGSGKSSLVGAGLIPRLRANAISTEHTGSKDWAVVQFTPGADKHPFEALFNALIKTFPHIKPSAFEINRLKAIFIEDMMQSPHALIPILDSALEKSPPWAEILFFIDQFEELFTGVTPATVDPFIGMVDSLCKHPRARVVITMRSDFYHRAVDNNTLSELLQNGSYPLSAPTGGALYRMITRPAERANLIFDDGLPEQLLADTGDTAGALALLAYTLDELYQIADKRGDNRITFADYEALGGVSGAIGKRAQAIYAQLPYADDDKKHILGRVFKELVEVDERGTATRQRSPFGRFDETEHTFIDAFAKSRLLVMGEGEHDDEVEVAHEALFRSWDTLKDWIAESQEDLILLRQVKNAAHEWQRKNYPDFLRWNHERLQLVYVMQARQNPTLSKIEHDFIEPEATRLLREIEIPKTPPARRVIIGHRLSAIGDPRPGVGVIHTYKMPLPAMVWCLIPAGHFTMGSDDSGQSDEKPAHTLYLPEFYMSRYLVTYAQYGAFENAPDFGDETWWDGFPDAQKRKTHDQQFKYANHPRETVTWYMAMAFCRWLTHHIGEATVPMRVWDMTTKSYQTLPYQKMKITLPSEAEYEKMARGTDGRIYPYGNDFDATKGNTVETGIGMTSGVGMFPQGESPYGVLDASGNVQKWTRSLKKDYKYNRNDGREDESGTGACIVRGGSWFDDADGARASYRVDLSPSGWLILSGFFVVCRPY